jgi:hypothetical protein
MLTAMLSSYQLPRLVPLIFVIGWVAFGTPEAAASWIYISQSQGYVSNYVDKTTIRPTKEKTITVWSKSEYKVPDENGWRSAVGLWEADCKNKQSRLLALVAFDQSGLSGNKVHQETETYSWTKATPNSNAALFLAAVC